MFLNKLSLKEFGKYNNKEIEMSEGVNIVCTKSSAASSSLKEFIVGMLYGINRFKGLGDSEKNYERIKSVSGKNSSGRIYIKKDGNSYFVERSFQKNSSKADVLEVASGREFKLKNKDTLYQSFVSVDKNTYTSALCIDADTGASAKDLSRDIEEYVTNMTLSGTEFIPKNDAVELLKEEKRKYDTRSLKREVDGLSEQIEALKNVDDELSDVRSKIREVEEEFAIETARRKREARKLVETEDGVVVEENEQVNESLDELTKNSAFLDKPDNDETEEKLTDKIWFILLTGLFVVGVIATMVNILPFEEGVRQLFVVCTILFVIITIVEGLYAKGVFEGEITTPSEEDFKRVIKELEQQQESEESVEIDMSFAEDFMNRKSELKEREEVLLSDKRRKLELEEEYAMSSTKLSDMEREVHAITLAINTINDISGDIQEKMKGLLTYAGEMIAVLTNGVYDDVRLEMSGHVTARTSGSYRNIEALPYEDIKLINIAVRLSVAKSLCNDCEPVILNGILDDMDIKTADEIISCASSIITDQIIVLTTNQELQNLNYNIVCA